MVSTEELARFRLLTTATKEQSRVNAVIMGRKTFESIPVKFRPLKGRLNVVISGRPKERFVYTASYSMRYCGELGYIYNYCNSFPDDVLVSNSLDGALDLLDSDRLRDSVDNIFVIGGAQVYGDALRHPRCAAIRLTQILSPDFECDTFFPRIDACAFSLATDGEPVVHEEQGVRYRFVVYSRREFRGIVSSSPALPR